MAKYMSYHLLYVFIYFAIYGTRKTTYMWLRYMYCKTSRFTTYMAEPCLFMLKAYARFADQSELSST